MNLNMQRIQLNFFSCLLSLCLIFPAALLAESKIYLIEVEGVIGPASQDLVIRGMASAAENQSPLIILKLNTPGGLDFSMRKIIAAILDSEIPVATYVAPVGARAASAGTYILYASHIAAMAPTTHLGAATPVQIGGMPEMPDFSREKQLPVSKAPPAAIDQVDTNQSKMEKKVLNDAVAYIRGLAELRDRNAEWAVLAVTEAQTLTASEALEKNVINFIANDITELLSKIDGMEIKTGETTLILATEGVDIERIQADWRNRLLAIITDPNIAYILMLVGIYGLIFEFSSPGFLLPGVVGAISLILALYAFQVLPVSFAGVALVVIGLTFIIAEAFVSSAGILGAGGLIAFVIGSIILFDDQQLAVSIPLIGGLALAAGGFLIWMVAQLTRLRNRQSVTGIESMTGKFGYVIADFSDHGRVRFNGESWLATSSIPVAGGEKVRVVSVDGLMLTVEPLE